MSYVSISVERRERVGIITLNRPQQFNTFNTALADELCKALLELEMDKAVGVVVLKGAGKAFCTGIDISEFHGKTLQGYREWIGRMEQALHVIASAHGYAVANGAGLIAACDLAIVAEGTKIGGDRRQCGALLHGSGCSHVQVSQQEAMPGDGHDLGSHRGARGGAVGHGEQGRAP